jgi:hypothetical protein
MGLVGLGFRSQQDRNLDLGRIAPALGYQTLALAGQKCSELLGANLLAHIVQEQNPEGADELHFHHRVPIIPI